MDGKEVVDVVAGVERLLVRGVGGGTWREEGRRGGAWEGVFSLMEGSVVVGEALEEGTSGVMLGLRACGWERGRLGSRARGEEEEEEGAVYKRWLL